MSVQSICLSIQCVFVSILTVMIGLETKDLGEVGDNALCERELRNQFLIKH